MHVLSCAIFVNAGSLLVTSEQNSILCQGVDYICPPKFQHVFIRELFFFYIFSRLFVSKVRDTVVRKLCSFFSFAFISIVFPCDLLLNERREKTHTKKQTIFLRAKFAFAVIVIHANDLCANSADGHEGKLEQLIFNLQVARNRP